MITAELLTELTEGCDGSETCSCPSVVFQDQDERCTHKACTGLHPDCGEPVEILEAL